MTDSRSPESLSGCRAEARRLLSHLRGGDPARARAAAMRFLRLRSLADIGLEGLLARPARVRLKHALAVVATEQGAPSWLALVRAFEARSAAQPGLPSFHTPRLDSCLNRWFTNHAEALDSLRREGGYLLPFRGQFFVTEAEGILALGLDPDDPDWSAIGFDLVKPLDVPAHERLCRKRRAAIAAERASASGGRS